MGLLSWPGYMISVVSINKADVGPVLTEITNQLRHWTNEHKFKYTPMHWDVCNEREEQGVWQNNWGHLIREESTKAFEEKDI